ncbi:SPT2 chromatin protein-domain-containing protein [Cokeromyces recurvatus]|uniref:SPT2 chromatin protein-domain-containing protein n=1 Tax=Cokeromyces recurvatus TaxID=90255 RepID=UPI00221F2D3B|nr:SPT2 chromatin protein-domain-containing protein [Cokeromyces recurvatus]KAI7906042.1 SPT2 chromatin protein-domain-containing protein [Cokeromyces recurvatus]
MRQSFETVRKLDAERMEQIRKMRREKEVKERKRAEALRKKEKAEAELAEKRELEEKKQKMLLAEKKKQKMLEKKRNQQIKTITPNKAINSTPISKTIKEKKKPVHMSFEEIMKMAKEQSTTTRDTESPSTTTNTSDKQASTSSLSVKRRHPDSSARDHTPSIYHRPKKPMLKKPAPVEANTMSARERAKIMVAQPPQKLGLVKRDRRTIEEIQRDIRHSKGKFSDDEEERPSSRNTTRPVSTKRQRSPPPPPHDVKRLKSIPASSTPTTRPYTKTATATTTTTASTSRPSVRSTATATAASSASSSSRPAMRSTTTTTTTTKSSVSRPVASDKRPPRPLRMPFTGKLLGPAPPSPLSRKSPAARRRYRDLEEEEDDDLADFIVDDDEGPASPHQDSYSSEIGRIFRYDRRKYVNEPISDDDMEANALEVLREEKRSERIGRREDLLEEQKELERQRRRKMKGL